MKIQTLGYVLFIVLWASISLGQEAYDPFAKKTESGVPLINHHSARLFWAAYMLPQVTPKEAMDLFGIEFKRLDAAQDEFTKAKLRAQMESDFQSYLVKAKGFEKVAITYKANLKPYDFEKKLFPLSGHKMSRKFVEDVFVTFNQKWITSAPVPEEKAASLASSLQNNRTILITVIGRIIEAKIYKKPESKDIFPEKDKNPEESMGESDGLRRIVLEVESIKMELELDHQVIFETAAKPVSN